MFSYPLGIKMAPKASYKDSVHILFRLMQGRDLVVGTASMVSGKTLPSDNISIQKCIQVIKEKATEIKIRFSLKNIISFF